MGRTELQQVAVHDRQGLPEMVTKRKRLVPSRRKGRNQPMTGSAKVYLPIVASPCRVLSTPTGTRTPVPWLRTKRPDTVSPILQGLTVSRSLGSH